MNFIIILLSMILILYLVYLSFKDTKRHQLEYIETGGLFVISLVYFVVSFLQSNNRLDTILESIVGVVFMFLCMLVFSLIKINGSNAFGGADIWVITFLSLALGISNALLFMIITCVVFITYIMILKCMKKERPKKIAFVPFITIGAIPMIIANLIVLL